MSKTCKGCGDPMDARGKHCTKCKKLSNIELSKQCHSKRRHERIAQGVCVICGGNKAIPSSEELSNFIATVDPRMIPYVTEEQLKDSTACYKCYAIRKKRSFQVSIVKIEAEAKITPEERARREAQKQERKKQINKERRERKIAENPTLCHHCLVNEKAEGRLWCEKCLEAVNERATKKIEERRKHGVCIVCKADSGGDQLCDACKIPQRQYSNKWWKKIRIERAEQGLCLRCGKVPSEPGRKACKECAESSAESNRKTRAAQKERAAKVTPNKKAAKAKSVAPVEPKKEEPKKERLIVFNNGEEM